VRFQLLSGEVSACGLEVITERLVKLQAALEESPGQLWPVDLWPQAKRSGFPWSNKIGWLWGHPRRKNTVV